jgi:hypothetical protein
MDRVDPHPVTLAGEFEGRRFGKQCHPALGQRIERIELRADEPGNRGQIDDGAAVRALPGAIAQCRQSALGPEKYPGQVDGAEPLPFFEARLLDALAEKEAGIVDQDVEPAETGNRRSYLRRPVLLAGYVEVQA